MTVYFDTSFVLPVLLDRHENHQACRGVVQQHLIERASLTTAAHTYGEIYRHLTRNVPPFELAPASVSKILLEQLPRIVKFVDASTQIYHLAIARCAQLGLRGAIICDALHLETAVLTGASVLYTDNTKDFNRLLTPDDALRIRGVR